MRNMSASVFDLNQVGTRQQIHQQQQQQSGWAPTAMPQVFLKFNQSFKEITFNFIFY